MGPSTQAIACFCSVMSEAQARKTQKAREWPEFDREVLKLVKRMIEFQLKPESVNLIPNLQLIFCITFCSSYNLSELYFFTFKNEYANVIFSNLHKN